jgi:class 3 adenylate cyclase/putative methionine-R-sulfoxide reductase with GAF domain
MPPLSLKRLIKKGVGNILNDIIRVTDAPITIQDRDYGILIGNGDQKLLGGYPVEVSGEVIGWVNGGDKAPSVAALLTYLADRELEKKTLGREALDKYKEINLLYNISEKIATSLDLEEVSRLIIEEARRSITATGASVMLLDEQTERLEIVSAFGRQYSEKADMGPGDGIAGNVILHGNAEIVNDVLADPRYIDRKNGIRSMICAPLKTKDRSIGVINLSSDDPVFYKAADLKLLTTLASQAASAIENAILHKKKLSEERIKSNLERYVASQIVDIILDAEGDISLDSEMRNIAILFSDIRGFTSTCENLAPEEIVKYLNEYFTQMVEVIFNNKGTVNKFVGDMIVALFGAPAYLSNNEVQAVRAAVEMQKRIGSTPNSWIRDHFNTGIGINSGDVVVGNIGSPQHMDYTAIGDEVNVASRIQAIAKGGQILVSRNIYNSTADCFQFRSIGSIKVKGKKRSVELFEVVY